jgi:hypothetical protein
MYSSIVVKECIQLYGKLQSYRAVERETGVGKSTIQRWYTKLHCMLKRHPLTKRKTRNAKFTTLKKDLETVVGNPELVLLSLRDIIEYLKYTPSQSTVSRMLKILKRRRRTMRFKAGNPRTPTSVTTKKDFEQLISNIPLEEILCLDETGFCNEGNMSHRYTLPINDSVTPKIIYVPSRMRVSTMACVSYNGLLTLKHIKGAYNSLEFIDFIINTLGPVKQPHHKYLLMDNVKFHHNKWVLEALEAIDITPIFIPAYSPTQHLAAQAAK